MAENALLNTFLTLFYRFFFIIFLNTSRKLHKSFVPVLQLTVTVLDVNDVTPMFEPQSYLTSVGEDDRELDPAEDRRILTISAKDDDEGDNAKIVYTITKGNEEG